MDFNLSPATYRKSSPYAQAIILCLMSLFWIPFLFSAKEYVNWSWFEYLFWSRLLLFFIPIPAFIYVLATKRTIEGFESCYYLFAMCVQATHGALEPSHQNDFYSYTSLMFLLSSLSYKGNFTTWIKWFLPVALIAQIGPLFTKSPTFFSSIGHFVDAFSFSIAISMLSAVILRLSITKYTMFEENIRLQQQLLQEKEQRLYLVEKELVIARKKIEDSTKLSVIGGISLQVAHDIRSPLSALDSILKDLAQLPEEKRILIRNAVGRIHDIANNLLVKYRKAPAQTETKEGGLDLSASHDQTPCLLSSLVESLISEKRLQFQSRLNIAIENRLDDSSYGLFAQVNPAEFKRVLSNLVNNAVEALKDRGSVLITLNSEGERIFIAVKDDGPGISPEILAKIGQKGESFGKAGGSGLGIYHAKTALESCGGDLEIKSELGKGTTALVKLPRAPSPDWFVSRLILNAHRPIVILDDDASIHQVWKGRFNSLKIQERGIETFHFSNPKDFRDWFKDHPRESSSAMHLSDYELLGHKETGLDLAEDLGIGPRTILVTSRYEEPEILKRCLKIGTRMIPKNLTAFVPLEVGGNLERPDAILIDDDPLTRKTWSLSAKRLGKKAEVFLGVADFLGESSKFEPQTPVYIDRELGNGVKGEEAAQKIYDLGFKEIYLSTGHEPETLVLPHWIKKAVGKSPPWEEIPA